MRALRIVLGSALTLLVALEIGTRIVRGEITANSEFAARGPLDVPYDLHPYFQTVRRSPWSDGNPDVLPGWCVTPEGSAFEPGRRRIFFIGGSTTACMYPEFARVEIEARAGPTSAFNVAHDWHCSPHSLYKFWSYCDLIRPNLVVVLDNINDFARGFTPPYQALPTYEPDYSHHSGALHPFWSRGRSRADGSAVFFTRPHAAYGRFAARDDTLSGLWNTLRRESAFPHFVEGSTPEPARPAPIYESMSDEQLLRALPDFERNLRNLARSARAKSVPIVFLTMPFTVKTAALFRQPGGPLSNDGVHLPDDASFSRGMRRFNDVVRSLDGVEGAHVVDMASIVTDPRLFKDEVHLCEAGQELEAKTFVEAAFVQGLLEPSAR